jgi:exodeoxyribonuclease V alpha subunit
MTIHKSQGSEFDNVVLPMSASHTVMLSTKLLYTAMTRAKTKLVITGEVYPFIRGVQKSEKKERNTLLEWLCDNDKKIDFEDY